MWIVRSIEDNVEDGQRHFFYGPFATKEEAQSFMDDAPDNEDLVEMDGYYMNPPSSMP
jgi:hypothetical protein